MPGRDRRLIQGGPPPAFTVESLRRLRLLVGGFFQLTLKVGDALFGSRFLHQAGTLFIHHEPSLSSGPHTRDIPHLLTWPNQKERTEESPKTTYNVSADRSQREAQNHPDKRTSPDHPPAHIGTYALARLRVQGAHIAGYALPRRLG